MGAILFCEVETMVDSYTNAVHGSGISHGHRDWRPQIVAGGRIVPKGCSSACTRTLADWMRSICAAIIAESQRREEVRDVKHMLPDSPFKFRFYRLMSNAAAALLGIMFLGAR